MATLAQPPAQVPTGSGIPTYSQVPETSFDCKFFAMLYRTAVDFGNPTLEIPWLMCDLYIVDWADLATLDLSLFDQPGGKDQLAKQLFDAIQNIGQ